MNNVAEPPVQRTIRIQPTAKRAWVDFTDNLAVALEALDEDEWLILSVKNSNRFVQFAAQGSRGMRAEATSDFYLPEDQHLTQEQYTMLLEIGWNAPTNLPDQLELGGLKPDGSPNYFLDVARPVPFDLMANLAVITLEVVFGAGSPGRLEYEASGDNNVSIRFPRKHPNLLHRCGDVDFIVLRVDVHFVHRA